jgi:hypothetical protein
MLASDLRGARQVRRWDPNKLFTPTMKRSLCKESTSYRLAVMTVFAYRSKVPPSAWPCPEAVANLPSRYLTSETEFAATWDIAPERSLPFCDKHHLFAAKISDLDQKKNIAYASLKLLLNPVTGQHRRSRQLTSLVPPEC